MKAILINYRPGDFYASPCSGRDSVLHPDGWSVTWLWDGKVRTLRIAGGFRAGVGVDAIPGFVMRIIRFFVNFLHMQRSSCAHDAIYTTQGGRRRDPLVEIVTSDGYISRREADALAHAIAAADGIAEWEGRSVHRTLHRFGKGAWNA